MRGFLLGAVVMVGMGVLGHAQSGLRVDTAYAIASPGRKELFQCPEGRICQITSATCNTDVEAPNASSLCWTLFIDSKPVGILCSAFRNKESASGSLPNVFPIWLGGGQSAGVIRIGSLTAKCQMSVVIYRR